MTLPAMFEGLDETPLARSPIVTVIWQLRFEDHPDLASARSALNLLEQLGGESTFTLTQLPRVQVALQAIGAEAPLAPAVGSSAAGWRLAATDGACQISLESGSVSVEAARYGSWETDFAPRLEALLRAIESIGPPVIESRLGLRYVNVVVGSAVGRAPFAAASDLNDVVGQWLLGPLSHDSLGPWVQVAQGRVAFRFDLANAILNHGVVSTEGGELGYLIDVDAFREGARAFSVAEVVERSTALHQIALGVFQSSLTDAALDAMRKELGSA